MATVKAPTEHAGLMVRTRRETLGWSRQELARRVGCNQNSILKAEGRRSWKMLRLGFALELCDHLGLSIHDVYAAGGDGWSTPGGMTG